MCEWVGEREGWCMDVRICERGMCSRERCYGCTDVRGCERVNLREGGWVCERVRG